jgi:hypothetical protein
VKEKFRLCVMGLGGKTPHILGLDIIIGRILCTGLQNVRREKFLRLPGRATRLNYLSSHISQVTDLVSISYQQK